MDFAPSLKRGVERGGKKVGKGVTLGKGGKKNRVSSNGEKTAKDFGREKGKTKTKG